MIKDYKKDRFFFEVFTDRIYKYVLQDTKKQVIVDVGALAGEFGIYVYDQAKVIYSIEPQKKYFKELEENVKKYELDKMIPINLALAGKNSDRKLSICGRGGASLANVKDKSETVKAVTLATFMKMYEIDHIDLLKIDIEDGEDEVFAAKDFRNVVDKIDLIIGEHLDKSSQILTDFGFEVIDTKKSNLIFVR